MTGGPDMTMKEAAAIAGALTQELDPRANVIWGARIRPDFTGKVRLMAIITGVKSAQVLAPSPVPAISAAKRKTDRCDKMSEMMLQVLALMLSIILAVGVVFSIRLYLEI